MFDKGYSFALINKIKVKEGYLVQKYLWKFTTRRKRVYHVLAEEYIDEIVIFKFYLKIDENKKDKYNLILNDGDAIRVIRTVTNILTHFVKMRPMASFGFIGAQKPEESRNTSQRFRVYSYVTKNFFGDGQFYHAPDPSNSVYLLVNKKSQNPLDLMQRASEMFVKIYSGLDLL